ncbi:30S ribosomal protein S21 [bacterium]|nr:30S ribosomal protein S21 [bacterium]
MAKKPVYAEVVAKPNEPIERLIRRFTKKVKSSGIMQELRDRSYYKKPSERRKMKKQKRLRTIRKLTKQNTN